MAGKAGLPLADRDAGQRGPVGPLPQDTTDVSAGAAQSCGHRHGPTAPEGKEACGDRGSPRMALVLPVLGPSPPLDVGPLVAPSPVSRWGASGAVAKPSLI